MAWVQYLFEGVPFSIADGEGLVLRAQGKEVLREGRRGERNEGKIGGGGGGIV